MIIKPNFVPHDPGVKDGSGNYSVFVGRLADETGVEWIGHLPNKEVYRVVGNAACLIFPSTGYESLPKTLIEAMAVGTPVIGSQIGSIPEIVTEAETGHLFPPGDPSGLALVVKTFLANQTNSARCEDTVADISNSILRQMQITVS